VMDHEIKRGFTKLNLMNCEIKRDVN